MRSRLQRRIFRRAIMHPYSFPSRGRSCCRRLRLRLLLRLLLLLLLLLNSKVASLIRIRSDGLLDQPGQPPVQPVTPRDPYSAIASVDQRNRRFGRVGGWHL
jgi:hypothetical protein